MHVIHRKFAYDQEDRRHRHRTPRTHSAAPPPSRGRPSSPVSPASAPSRPTGSPSTTSPCTSPHRPRCAPKRCSSAWSSSASTRPPSSPSSRLARHGRMPASPTIDPVRLGVDYSTGIGGLWTLLDAWDTLREKGPRRVLPMTIPMLMPNAAAAAVSMAFDARAFARTDVCACASSTEAIANAYEHLQLGLADVVLAGGTESCIHPMTLASFASMQALSKRNDDPATASRPYDVDRDGFVLGEGAATHRARDRGARPRSRRPHLRRARRRRRHQRLVPHHRSRPRGPRRRACRLRRARAGRRRPSTTSPTSTRTRRARPSATSPSTRRCCASSAITCTTSPSRPRRRRTATCSVEPARSRRSSRSSRCRSALAPPTINLANLDPAIPLDVGASRVPLGDGPQLAHQQLVRLRRPQRRRCVPQLQLALADRACRDPPISTGSITVC